MPVHINKQTAKKRKPIEDRKNERKNYYISLINKGKEWNKTKKEKEISEERKRKKQTKTEEN